MGASNNESTGMNVIFFKFKEDKADNSKTKNQLRFYKQVKNGESWADGPSFSSMDGYLTDIETSSYEWQGKTKDTLKFTLTDTAGIKNVINLGLDSNIAKQLLNTFVGEEKLGEIKIECGEAKEHKGKYYPTMYVKNNGQKTTWKFSKANNNMDQVPEVVSKTDEDGNNIRTGVKANLDFWKAVVGEVKLTRCVAAPAPVAQPAAEPSTVETDKNFEDFLNGNDIEDSLPF